VGPTAEHLVKALESRWCPEKKHVFFCAWDYRLFVFVFVFVVVVVVRKYYPAYD